MPLSAPGRWPGPGCYPPAWDCQGADLHRKAIQGSLEVTDSAWMNSENSATPVLQERERRAWPWLMLVRPLLRRMVMDGRQQVPDPQEQSMGGKGMRFGRRWGEGRTRNGTGR